MDFLGLARHQQSLDRSSHRATSGQHGVDNDERLVLHAGSSDIVGLDAHLGMLTVDIHTKGGDIGIVGMVKHIEEALVERQSGTQHSAQHDIVLDKRYLGSA